VKLNIAAPDAYGIFELSAQRIERIAHCQIRVVVAMLGARIRARIQTAARQGEMRMHLIAVSLAMAVVRKANGDVAALDIRGEMGEFVGAALDFAA
jgi:hypothetical protein